MGEISIKIDNLTQEIEKLNNLKEKISTSEVKRPETVGSGGSIQELERLGKNYQDMNGKVADLVSNTVSFFENVKESYEKNDQIAANNFTMSGR